MKLKIFLFALAMLTSVSTLAADKLPSDVKAFIERHDLCEHFAGEEPYNEERRAFLQKKINETCTKRDKDLAKLKHKYKNNKQVQKKLKAYESSMY